MHDLDLGALLVTRGEHGMTLLRPDHPALHLPARAREVFDVTGAGDTVISTLAAAIAAGEELPHAVALANLAAGIVVGKLGTAAISAPELRRAIQREEGSERGVLGLEQLLLAVDDARAHNERIVFTNGCFDILHAGHVTYLEQARAQGDRLIVAVNDDASVSRLKGPGRPINSVDRRMAVLAGLGAVDWVISFPEGTPENLLREVKPDVLVKGGDYGIDQVVGADIVTAYGGTVKVLGLVENSSTTAIVEKIRSPNEASKDRSLRQLLQWNTIPMQELSDRLRSFAFRNSLSCAVRFSSAIASPCRASAPDQSPSPAGVKPCWRTQSFQRIRSSRTSQPSCRAKLSARYKPRVLAGYS